MLATCFTVDVEDWFHVCGIDEMPPVQPDQWLVSETTLHLLDLFDELGIRGTFFMLGSVAAARPDLASRIATRGHEVASHGYSHKLVYELTPEQFHEEIIRTSDLIAGQTGKAPVGFRAPQWSLGEQTPWAFDILAREGYLYDSSCTPLKFIGNPNGPVEPYRLSTSTGSLWEIPPLVTPTLIGNLPCGGGWGLRLLPLWTILKGIKNAHAGGNPAVFFLHPREVNPNGPRLDLPLIKRFAAYGTRRDVAPIVRRLVQTGTSIPLREMVESWQSAS